MCFCNTNINIYININVTETHPINSLLFYLWFLFHYNWHDLSKSNLIDLNISTFWNKRQKPSIIILYKNYLSS